MGNTPGNLAISEYMLNTDRMTDAEYRVWSAPQMRQYLEYLASLNITVRSEIPPLFDHDYPFIDGMDLQAMLCHTGWLPLDSIYKSSDGWKNAEMYLGGQTIDQAMRDYLIPNNRNWCYCLASDFHEKTNPDKFTN
jgi:hypothetical protein